MAEREKMDPTLVRISAAVLVGAMAVVFNTTIVSVALPTLVTELNTTLDVVQWVTTAYLLAMFVTIPVAGWAQNRFGGKNLWIASLAGFLVTSILCGVSWNVGSLIIFRALQGLSGGFVMPLMTTLIMQSSNGKNLGRLMSTVTLPVALGPVIGPVIGGVVMNLLSWEWIFFISVPFAAVGLWMAATMIPASEKVPPRPLDGVGLVLLSPAAIALIYGLSNVSKDNGLARTDAWLPIVIGAVLLAGFVAWCLPRGDRALLDLRLLARRGPGSTTALNFFTGIAVNGAMLLLPMYLQLERGADTLDVGLLLIPQGLGALAARFFAGRATDTLGARVVAMVGFGIMTVMTVPFAFADADTSIVFLLIVLFLRGIGQGMVSIPLSSASFVGLKGREIADVSIIGRTSMQLGGSFGTAVLAVILAGAMNNVSDPTQISHAVNVSFWWAVGFTAAAVVLSMILPGRLKEEDAVDVVDETDTVDGKGPATPAPDAAARTR
jgi:EmrB/QacA subfamily drug resistance transporter